MKYNENSQQPNNIEKMKFGIHILLLISIFEDSWSLELNCYRQFDLFSCSCKLPSFNNDRFESLAGLLNSELRADTQFGSTDQFYVVNRTPVSCGVLRTEPNPTRRRGSWTSLSVDSSNVRKISQIFITDCPEKLRLEFDLDRLDSQLATITDVTFKNISSLVLKFSGIQRPRMTLVFTDINNLELSGNLPGRENKLEFFFRDCRRDRGTNIVINRMKIDGTVQLLNFQDIASLSVYDTDIASLQDVDFFQVDRCYNKISDFRPTSCTKQDLFQDQYSSTYWPPVTTDRTTSSSTENTPQPYISEVTSNPLFIVGMVILAALILIAIPVILFVRHQNRRTRGIELFT